MTDGAWSTYYSSLFSIQSNYITVGNRNGGYAYHSGGKMVNNISTEDYNTLVMEIDGYLHPESWQANWLGYGFKNAVENSIGTSMSPGKNTISLDISKKHNTEGYVYILNFCDHAGSPYSGYDPNSYIKLYSAYLKK